MAKIVLGLIAVIACFVLAESLTCNKCTASLFGYCLGSDNPTCGTNTSVCFTYKATFPSVKSFAGFSQQGCTESTKCNSNTTINNTLPFLGITYKIETFCCSNDKCNPVTLNGAPSTKMTLSVALSAAAMAALWGSFM